MVGERGVRADVVCVRWLAPPTSAESRALGLAVVGEGGMELRVAAAGAAGGRGESARGSAPASIWEI